MTETETVKWIFILSNAFKIQKSKKIRNSKEWKESYFWSYSSNHWSWHPGLVTGVCRGWWQDNPTLTAFPLSLTRAGARWCCRNPVLYISLICDSDRAHWHWVIGQCDRPRHFCHQCSYDYQELYQGEFDQFQSIGGNFAVRKVPGKFPHFCHP